MFPARLARLNLLLLLLLLCDRLLPSLRDSRQGGLDGRRTFKGTLRGPKQHVSDTMIALISRPHCPIEETCGLRPKCFGFTCHLVAQDRLLSKDHARFRRE